MLTDKSKVQQPAAAVSGFDSSPALVTIQPDAALPKEAVQLKVDQEAVAVQQVAGGAEQEVQDEDCVRQQEAAVTPTLVQDQVGPPFVHCGTHLGRFCPEFASL